MYLLKLKAYVLGGCVAGLGGALLASYITAFNPYGWTPQETFLIYAALFIGGTGNAIGAVIGTFFVEVGVQEVTRYVPQIGNNASSGDAIRLVIIGLMIVGILWWRPARRAARAARPGPASGRSGSPGGRMAGGTAPGGLLRVAVRRPPRSQQRPGPRPAPASPAQAGPASAAKAPGQARSGPG